MNIAEKMIRELILRARAYDGKEQIEDFQADQDTDGSGNTEGLQTGEHDPIRGELQRWFDGHDEEALAELVALYWIGRGDFDGKAFSDAVNEARSRRTTPTADYLLGAPLLGDYLEIGLDAVIEAGVYDDA